MAGAERVSGLAGKIQSDAINNIYEKSQTRFWAKWADCFGRFYSRHAKRISALLQYLSHPHELLLGSKAMNGFDACKITLSEENYRDREC